MHGYIIFYDGVLGQIVFKTFTEALNFIQAFKCRSENVGKEVLIAYVDSEKKLFEECLKWN